MAIDKKQAFHDILKGEGNVPYLTSAWQHLIGHEYGAQKQARAHIDFVSKWDWDWVKINPRSAYHSEIWGAHSTMTIMASVVLPLDTVPPKPDEENFRILRET